jgi:uncharacterized protein (UPF0332 family)
METGEENRAYVRFKLTQAREAYEDAQGLLADGAGLSYVVNSLFYAFYYPVLAMLRARGVPAAMQSVSISLFEKTFSEAGIFEHRFFRALRMAFELKPKCSAPESIPIDRAEVEMLLVDFQEAVGKATGLDDGGLLKGT